ncbi:MAG: hypothetical protein ACHBN1_11795 [Heteroscytonema crispum UTEX LB 1556]
MKNKLNKTSKLIVTVLSALLLLLLWTSAAAQSTDTQNYQAMKSIGIPQE